MQQNYLDFTKRQAIWEAHNKRCFYCGELLLFKDCELDHIIPISLKKKPVKLKSVLSDYGLPRDFNLDSLENYLPCHKRCNQQKGDRLYSKNVVLHYIEQAKFKIERIKKIYSKYCESLERNRVEGFIKMSIEQGLISKQDVLLIIDNIPDGDDLWTEEMLVFTFGINIQELFDKNRLPKEAPTLYPYLCDWLENHLIEYLTSLVSCAFCYTEASFRNGETLSVRIGFWNLKEKELERFSDQWFEILEIKNFSEIYGYSAREFFKDLQPNL